MPYDGHKMKKILPLKILRVYEIEAKRNSCSGYCNCICWQESFSLVQFQTILLELLLMLSVLMPLVTTPPSTIISLHQKLDLVLANSTEQKATIDELQRDNRVTGLELGASLRFTLCA